MLTEMPFTLGQCSSICVMTGVICQRRWMTLLPAFFPYLRVELSPAVNQSSFYKSGFYPGDSALSWWMVWVKAVFLREDTRGQLNCCEKAALTRMRIAEEGRFLLRGNKLKCCFPVDSSPNIQSDINQRLGCKSYRACKLVTVVYSFLNNLRQFLSRVLRYLTNTTNEKKTELDRGPCHPQSWQVQSSGAGDKGLISAHVSSWSGTATLPKPIGPQICQSLWGEILKTPTWTRLFGLEVFLRASV